MMRATQPITISLPTDIAQMLKDKVSSGEYATESDVIRDGLQSLSDRDATIDRWLREEVSFISEDAQQYPERLLTADQVRARLAAHIDALVTKPRS